MDGSRGNVEYEGVSMLMNLRAWVLMTTLMTLKKALSLAMSVRKVYQHLPTIMNGLAVGRTLESLKELQPQRHAFILCLKLRK